MLFPPPRRGRQRGVVLALSYLSLGGIGLLSWLATDVHVGALAVIPLLFIAYYAPLSAALATAFIAGIALALADSAVIAHGAVFRISPLPDALAFSVTLCAVVFLAERLRTRTRQNAALRESLNEALSRAEQDTLTGIGNRRFFLRRLRTALHSLRAQERAGILFADLDGFKAVNDGAGHAIGDRLLVLAAERLRHAIRSHDVLARIGGDEFAILVERLRDSAEMAAIAENIEAQFSDPFNLDRVEHRVGITLGAAIAPADGRDPEMLLQTADRRMYQKKEAKRASRTLE